MKWRLDEAAYDSDAMKTLDAGTEVGDGCENLWRYPMAAKDSALAGKPRPPSRSMTPMDKEAQALFVKTFPNDPPPKDPTELIPLKQAHQVPIDSVPRDAAGHTKVTQPAQPPGTMSMTPPRNPKDD